LEATVEKELLIRVLESEIERTTGCTDPVTVSLAVSRAARELGKTPESVVVTVSPNIYKNAIDVGVPGTNGRGLHIAAALGAVLDKSEAELAILDYVTESNLAAATELVSDGSVVVRCEDAPDVLYVKAEVSAGQDTAYAIISNDYSNIVEVGRNNQVTFSSPTRKTEAVKNLLKGASLREIFEVIEVMTLEDLSFLVEAAYINREAAEVALSDSRMKLGPALNRRPSNLPAPFSAVNKGEILAGAAAEARMSGLKVPVVAVAGSGNQGITSLLGVLAVAEELDSSEEELARALAISTAVTILFKSFAARMTAFCGSAMAAGAGVAGGTTYLLGGGFEDAVHAMQSTIGSLACILCDGAKESCAYKISASVATAIQSAFLALEGAYIPAGMGILGDTIEETFENLGVLNNPGMVETDRLMLRLIEKGRP
jgi:L-cysteine desulfidase